MEDNKVNYKEGYPTFDEPTDFVIKNFWSGDGKAEITVNNKEVFKMVRLGQLLDPTIVSAYKLAIDSLSGERLLSIRESQNANGIEMELCRKDPALTNSQIAVPICKVVRKSNTLTMHHRYEVQLVGEESSISCSGHWPNGFAFDEANPSGSTPEEKQLASAAKSISTNSQEWTLQVAAGADVVLFIGIVYAISHMSQETKNQKELFITNKLVMPAMNNKGTIVNMVGKIFYNWVM